MEKTVPVEISARHVHLNEQDLASLFGEGYKLTPKKDLSQPGQFACVEKVQITGPRGTISASVLGPVRKATQVELSFTDARTLGLTVPVRESGDIAGSAGCKLTGPAGEIEIKEGAIAAKRHVHMTTADASRYGLSDAQNVRVALKTEGRALVFDDVVVRVSDNYALAMHIDTDEANAAAVPGSCTGIILD